MVIVIAIVALLLALATPLLMHATPQQKLREAASELVSNIRLARSMVISGQTVPGLGTVDAVDVVFNDAANSYSIVAWNLTSPAPPQTMKTVNLADKSENIDLTLTIVPT